MSPFVETNPEMIAAEYPRHGAHWRVVSINYDKTMALFEFTYEFLMVS